MLYLNVFPLFLKLPGLCFVRDVMLPFIQYTLYNYYSLALIALTGPQRYIACTTLPILTLQFMSVMGSTLMVSAKIAVCNCSAKRKANETELGG